jgi:hypothetical protein
VNRDLLYRLGGLVLFGGGLGLGWFEILRPLRAAMNHAPDVRYDTKIFVLVPVCLVFGMFFLAGGARWPYRDVERKTLTPAGWGLMAAVAIAGLASFLWFQQQFTALGYHYG